MNDQPLRSPANGRVAEKICNVSRRLTLAAGACLIALPVTAAESGLRISDAWIRMIIPSRPAAGYFTLSNDAEKPASLVGVASPACSMVMMHQSKRQGSVESMAMVEAVAVPAHGKLTFAPGGYHLMCMEPGKAMVPGQSVPMTFRFADGGTLTTNFPVRNAAGK